jgi:hypothetical protein
MMLEEKEILAIQAMLILKNSEMKNHNSCTKKVLHSKQSQSKIIKQSQSFNNEKRIPSIRSVFQTRQSMDLVLPPIKLFHRPYIQQK